MAKKQRKTNYGKSNPAGKLVGLVLLIIVAVLYFTGSLDFLLDNSYEASASPTATVEPVSATLAATPEQSYEAEPTDRATPLTDKTPLPSDGALYCYMVDVKQGDCLILVSPDGKTMLVDCGYNEQYGAVSDALDALDIETLDIAVATHPHADHIGCMAKVIRNYRPGAFYMTDFVSTTTTYEKMIEALEDCEIPTYQAQTGLEVEWSELCTVTILSPIKDESYDDSNESSIVLRVSYGETSILLTGDAGTYAEDKIIRHFDAEDFESDVIKLGHHGSSSASSERFMKLVNPEAAICSLEKDNSYGHPHRETLELLEKLDIPLYRSDELGSVLVTLDGTKITIKAVSFAS